MTKKGVRKLVIDPKIPLTLTLSPKGRGDLIISPPLRGGDKGEGDISVLSCELMALIDSCGNGNPEDFNLLRRLQWIRKGLH